MREQNKAYDRILKYTGVFGGTQSLITVMTVLRTKLVTLLIGPAGMGINGSFNRTLNLVKSTTDLGIHFSSVRDISECIEENNREKLDNILVVVRSWVFLTAILGTAVCITMSHLFSLWGFGGDKNYTLSFLLLSPVVGFSAINGGEIAIIKGARMLKQMAVSQLLAVIAGLCISVPLFYYFGLLGLVPSLVLVSLSSMIITCYYSFKTFPYKIAIFNKKSLGEGLEMIRVGIFFTLASFFGAGAYSIITNYLMNSGAEVTGFYEAGNLLVSYLGLFVFSAMEADYYPRLSSINRIKSRVNELANQQIEVASLLISPLLVAFIIGLPLLVVVFLTPRFSETIVMAQFAVISLSFKAMTQPIAYISLAKADSKIFLLQELLYDTALVVLVLVAFKLGGLNWIGYAIALAGLLDWIMVMVITKRRYGFILSKRALKVFLIQIPSVIVALVVTFKFEGWWYWIVGGIVILFSSAISIYYLRKNTTLIDNICHKIKNRFKL